MHPIVSIDSDCCVMGAAQSSLSLAASDRSCLFDISPSAQQEMVDSFRKKSESPAPKSYVPEGGGAFG
jgi:hypothetical protein